MFAPADFTGVDLYDAFVGVTMHPYIYPCTPCTPYMGVDLCVAFVGVTLTIHTYSIRVRVRVRG